MGFIKEQKIYTVEETDTFVVGATCDKCSKELEPVWEEDGVWRIWEAKESLKITLSGEYAGDEPQFIVLCKDCADSFCEMFPSVKFAISQREEE